MKERQLGQLGALNTESIGVFGEKEILIYEYSNIVASKIDMSDPARPTGNLHRCTELNTGDNDGEDYGEDDGENFCRENVVCTKLRSLINRTNSHGHNSL